MKTKLSVTILITVIALITGCDSMWQVSETSDVVFTIDTRALHNVKNISNGVRNIESDDLSKITISLHDATDDSEIERKTATFTDDEAEIEFKNLKIVGKTIYAKALLENDGEVKEGRSKATEMVEGSNFLQINFNEDDNNGSDDNGNDTDDENDDDSIEIGIVVAPKISMTSIEATPTDSPIGNKLVTLTSTTPDAQIYYTIDGSDPATNGIAYNDTPFNLLLGSEAIELQAIAKNEGYEDSNVTSETYEKLLSFTYNDSSDSYSVGHYNYLYEGDIIIPATHNDGVNGEGDVTSVVSYAFYQGNLSSVSFPNTLKNFEQFAFSYCPNLTTVSISEGVTSIGENAFRSNDNLESVSIPASVTTIGEGTFTISPKLQTFELASTSNFNIARDNKSIAEALFNIKTQTVIATASGDPDAHYQFNLPHGITHIGDYSFWGYDNLEVLWIPTTLETIGSLAFAECPNLREFYVLGGNFYKDIDYVLYTYDGTELVHYPQALPSESFIVPSGVEIFSEYIFFENQFLKSVIIPSTVTSLGSAFNALSKLTSKATVYALHSSINSFDVSDVEVPVVWGCLLSTDNTYLVSVTDVKIEGNSSLELQAPYRTGHTFSGWSRTEGAPTADPGFETADSLRSVNNSSDTYYAVWK